MATMPSKPVALRADALEATLRLPCENRFRSYTGRGRPQTAKNVVGIGTRGVIGGPMT
jgi:hypothetical protein